ncbi:carbon-monoxide dehydrogenase medium subunit [Streptomyces sulfonofaciens]|uniref:Carbon-monoxide dehydrogenase medium subunit n=1 Tax=Streptomyces sulfonofaciens TaxID=68272 RepID=A0A919G308_9ACTN|nr:FAD binding domain-containing protein [Streptomyces sulfonofaciens]GHH77162.1 carbon-monoxide dehydrogenase medium subunit [Streptomyces sulfonofaciens]
MTTLDSGPLPVGASPAPVTLLTPATLDEALRLIAGGGAAVLGGGVGHTLRRGERRRPAPSPLVSVAHLPGLTGITRGEDHLAIGAGVRLAACAADEELGRAWPVLTEAAGSVATGRIREMVTLGGNIAARDDSHDPPVALTAVGATLAVRSATGSRTLTVPEAARLRPDELIEHVRVPLPAPRTGSAYEKFLVRGVWEYACVNVAAVVTLEADGTAGHLALAVGSVAGGPVAVDLTGLAGAPADAALVAEAADRAAATTSPYGDVRGSAAYKTRMIAEFARRALTTAVRRAAAAPDRPSKHSAGGDR